MSDNTLKVNILSSVFGRKFSSHMNIFSLVFLMHVLERKNEESFDLVLPYMSDIGMCRCEEYGFQAVYAGIGHINQRVWV